MTEYQQWQDLQDRFKKSSSSSGSAKKQTKKLFTDLLKNQEAPEKKVRDELEAKFGKLTEEFQDEFKASVSKIVNKMLEKISSLDMALGGKDPTHRSLSKIHQKATKASDLSMLQATVMLGQSTGVSLTEAYKTVNTFSSSSMRGVVDMRSLMDEEEESRRLRSPSKTSYPPLPSLKMKRRYSGLPFFPTPEPFLFPTYPFFPAPQTLFFQPLKNLSFQPPQSFFSNPPTFSFEAPLFFF